MPKNRKQIVLLNLPSWIPLETWNAYLDMRKTIKKPMTEYAMQLAVKKLWQYKQQGMSVQDILEQSIFNSWQGLFPILNYNGNGHGKAEQVENNRNNKYRKIASGVIGIPANNGAGLQDEYDRTRSFVMDRYDTKLLKQ